jgi:hypothetical protein
MSGVSSILRQETMLTTVNNPMLFPEVATAASALPCWHSFDERRQPGNVLTLAGRCAR